MSGKHPATAEPEVVLVRYGELALKGKNRGQFEEALARNLRAALERVAPVRVRRSRGRMVVVPEGRAWQVARRAALVFGVKSVSPAWGAEPDPEAIGAVAEVVLDDALARLAPGAAPTFRVETRRADKRFPLTSVELDRLVAARVLPRHPELSVDLSHPELTLGIDVRPERAWLFAHRLPGPGGLPVGTLGRVLSLLSGGIDSPVASWLAMKRGCRVAFVSFHSYPYIGEASRKKVVDLVRILARYQPRSRLFVVPFTDVQVAVRDSAPEAYRTVLYRRAMQRIASRLAAREKATALVTGESLGQVASQTIENLACIEAAADLPVLRPLVTFDKEEAIEIARRIGTFETSCRPEPDCCTVFQPSKPVIRGRLEECLAAEERFDVAGLTEAALAGTCVLDVEPDR